MASKNFLLVSLEEDKAKELAQIVSNDICRKILDHLAAKEATETDISKALNIPLSTVHYNLKQLLKSGIVKAEEFHYSEKGREVLHYSLANKYIIIAPKSTATESLAAKLKKILPVFMIVAATGAVIQLISMFSRTATLVSNRIAAPLVSSDSGTATAVQKAVGEAATAVPQAAQPLMQAATDFANATVAPIPEPIQQVATAQPSIALWFLAGALFALIVYLIYDAVNSRQKE